MARVYTNPLYLCWRNIIAKCTNPRRVDWEYYGGRGIAVCERWQTFETFEADMLPTWTKGSWIDRVDNSGNYEPGNCRWVTPRESALNRRARADTGRNGPSFKGRKHTPEAREKMVLNHKSKIK